MWSTGLSLRLSILVVLSTQPFLTEGEGSAPITPTPTAVATPRGELYLGAYAQNTKLNRTVLETGPEQLLITTETVQELQNGGHLTIGTPALRSQPTPSSQPGTPDSGREAWRARVLRQKDQVAKVHGEIVLLDARIDALQSTTVHGRDGAARRRSRLLELEGRRLVLAHQLTRERTRLVALIRRAREQGAEPGWFR